MSAPLWPGEHVSSPSTLELVATAVADPSLFKDISAELERREPDASAALALVTAFREGGHRLG